MKKTRLNKKELMQIYSVYERLCNIEKKYDDESDIPCQIEGNGSVASNLSCAVAALETILQEYQEELR